MDHNQPLTCQFSLDKDHSEASMPDVIAQLEHYFRSSALSGEDNLPRWATFSSLEG